MVIEARTSLILSFDSSTEVTLQEKCRRRARGLLVLNSVGVGADESTSMTSHVNKLSKFHQLFISNLPKSVMSRQTKAEFLPLKRSMLHHGFVHVPKVPKSPSQPTKPSPQKSGFNSRPYLRETTG